MIIHSFNIDLHAFELVVGVVHRRRIFKNQQAAVKSALMLLSDSCKQSYLF